MKTRPNRTAAIDKAARLVREGALAAAMDEYQQLLEQDPGDWAVGNALGDLYVRMGSIDDAVTLFMDLAEKVAELGYTAKARALYRKVLRVQPHNEDAAARVSELENEHLGSNPFMQRIRGALREARAAEPPEIRQPPESAPDEDVAPSSDDWVEPTLALAAAPLPDGPPRDTLDAARQTGTFQRLQASVQRSISTADYRGGADAVEQFLRTHPNDVGALEMLIELGVDGGIGDVAAAQLRLARVCLDTMRASAARDIGLDLLYRYPDDPRVAELTRSLFDAAGIAPPAPTAEPIGDPPVEGSELELFDDDGLVTDETRRRKRSYREPRHGDRLERWPDSEQERTAHEALSTAERHAAEGDVGRAIAVLEPLMRTAALQPLVGVPLAQFYRCAGNCERALRCLEQVADQPPAGDDSSHALAYELALTLEAMGHGNDALCIYRDLLSEVGPGFRDVAVRARQLSAA